MMSSRFVPPWTTHLLLASLVLVCTHTAVATEATRVLPAGEQPPDARLEELKTLNGYFPFTPPESLDHWHLRAEQLRRQLLVSQGLWPMPGRTSPEAVVHGRIDRGDYTVEKVYLQSYPGHYVTGNLYRPTGKKGRLPAVLSPHGHWADGRFYDAGAEAIKQQIVTGAERFEDTGRNPIQSRCVQLARMGCIVFNYDMIGYADSGQLPHGASPREQMNTPENWGFSSPQAELRLQTTMGLQTYNSLRALDWLCELPDVDPSRIAVTGASGGGTQTFMLCAIDPRPAVAFPAVMVSTAMQGGCTCENASYLRVGTGNVEIAALFAPKPLGMTTADDWTREFMTKGYPELRALYQLYGQPSLVMAHPLTHFGHNYNYVSRAVMYGWLNQHLGLGLSEPIVEEHFTPLTQEELSVWNDEHPRPPAGEEYERELLAAITAESDAQLAELLPRDPKSMDEYRRVVGGAWDVLLGHISSQNGPVTFEETAAVPSEEYTLRRGLLREQSRGTALPTLIFTPAAPTGRVLVWVHGEGKAGLLDAEGAPTAELRSLLSAGKTVIAADLFQQGEFLADGEPLTSAPLAKDRGGNVQTYAGYTYGYNLPIVAQRAQDVAALIRYAKELTDQEQGVQLLGTHGAALEAAAAAAFNHEHLAGVALDTAGFRCGQLERIDDPRFLPGAVKYGDLPGLISLIAPVPVFVVGEAKIPEAAGKTYSALGSDTSLTMPTGDDGLTELIGWLSR